MAITKDQQRFVILSAGTLCLLIICGLCINILFNWREQLTINAKKQARILSLQQTLQNIPEEVMPSSNPFEALQKSGGPSIARITQDKDITCELNCTYTQLISFLQKYAAAPDNIQSMHVLRDKKLLVTLHIISGKIKNHE